MDKPIPTGSEVLVAELRDLVDTPFEASCCNSQFPILSLRRALEAAADMIEALTAAQQPVQEGGGARLTNPWTGEPRDYRDVNSDPAGTLCVEPGAPLKAAPPSAPVGAKTLQQFMAEQEAKHPGIHDKVEAAADELRASLTKQPAQAAPGDDKVLWGVVANAGRLSPTRQQRWAHVMDATGQGSQSSIALCRRFGFDPDETVGVEEDTPPGDDAAGGGQ